MATARTLTQQIGDRVAQNQPRFTFSRKPPTAALLIATLQEVVEDFFICFEASARVKKAAPRQKGKRAGAKKKSR